MEQPLSEGRIPGYQGYIPGMKNHLIGNRYSEATRRAVDCQDALNHGENPSGMESLLDSRPQGRDFLYAQVADTGVHAMPRVNPVTYGKNRPFVNDDATGKLDFRRMTHVIGGHGPAAPAVHMTVTQSASLPVLTFDARKFVTRKVYSAVPDTDVVVSAKLPGYTGHQHASQHVYGHSYGTSARLLEEGGPDSNGRSLRLQYFGEERPIGAILTEKHRIPGYSGYIPGKDNHIYSKTYGQATELAPIAVDEMAKHKGIGLSTQAVSKMKELVDERPQGKVDLFAQGYDINAREGYTAQPEPLHVVRSLARPNVTYLLKGKDHKLRERNGEDVELVKEGSHHVVGYTGHVHGHQHVYAESFGKMTRGLRGFGQEHPTTGPELLYFEDDRPEKRDLDAFGSVTQKLYRYNKTYTTARPAGMTSAR